VARNLDFTLAWLDDVIVVTTAGVLPTFINEAFNNTEPVRIGFGN
jgi:hypothetical protein